MQYFDDVLKVCGIAVLCVIALMVTTRLGNFGIGTALRLCGGLLIFGVFETSTKCILALVELSLSGEFTNLNTALTCSSRDILSVIPIAEASVLTLLIRDAIEYSALVIITVNSLVDVFPAASVSVS